jgi:Domain of unknown function (DUF5666)
MEHSHPRCPIPHPTGTMPTRTFFCSVFCTLALITGIRAQVAPPAPSEVSSERGAAHQAATAGDNPLLKPGSKVSLVRGVLKRLDPIHDQLVIHAFGGGDVRIAFDPRTQLLPENPHAHLTGLPLGSAVSVDTVINEGKLFAVTVRTGPSNAAELNGQVVRYDAAKSQLTLRDPISPEGISLHIDASTAVTNQGHAASVQALAPGMLVRVWFSPTKDAANKIEIFAERGNSFTFEGKVVSVDLRSRVLSLSNESDQSVRELAIGSLDAPSLNLLREGADVNIRAEFDGDRYNVRAVSLMPHTP